MAISYDGVCNRASTVNSINVPYKTIGIDNELFRLVTGSNANGDRYFSLESNLPVTITSKFYE